MHETAVTAKRLILAYYDRPQSYSYWDGCSTGGRQGLISAQRYPGDFDGIVDGAPVLDFSGVVVIGPDRCGPDADRRGAGASRDVRSARILGHAAARGEYVADDANRVGADGLDQMREMHTVIKTVGQ